MSVKDELHRLIESLPGPELLTARRFLETLHHAGNDPLLEALAAAPADDEPLTPEEEAAVHEAYEAIERGDVVSHDELRRQLGL